MQSNRPITIVRGYHLHGPPDEARAAGLLQRFAVVICPFEPANGYADTNYETYQTLLQILASVLEFEAMSVISFDETEVCFSSFAEFEHSIRPNNANHDDEPEPPVKILFHQSGDVCSLVETEFWNMVGGHAPYHDSYTVSFYTRSDMGDLFQNACEREAKSAPRTIQDVILASHEPVTIKFPLWRRILSFLLSDDINYGFWERAYRQIEKSRGP